MAEKSDSLAQGRRKGYVVAGAYPALSYAYETLPCAPRKLRSWSRRIARTSHDASHPPLIVPRALHESAPRWQQSIP
eukprot:1762400-Amphidinium_carterae.1